MRVRLHHLLALPRVVRAALVGLALVIGVGGLGAPASAVTATTTTLETSPAVLHWSDTVTLTARVTGTGGDPVTTGGVAFRLAADMFDIGGPSAVVLEPVPVDSDGVASTDIELSPGDLPFLLTADTVVVMAQYVPTDADLAISVSAPTTLDVTDVVVAQPTTTTVTGPSVATAGQPTSLTATVSPATAAGTVQFSVDGTPVGGPVAVSLGSASRQHTFTTAGSATVTASFTPDVPAAYAASWDATGRAVTVSAPAPTSTTTMYTGTTEAITGTAATLSATVSPATAVGTMEFRVSGILVGSVPVSTGSASQPYTFTTSGFAGVLATFVPATAAYASSSGSTFVTISTPLTQTTPGTAGGAGQAIAEETTTLSGCASDQSAGRAAARKAVNRTALRAKIRASILSKISRFTGGPTGSGSGSGSGTGTGTGTGTATVTSTPGGCSAGAAAGHAARGTTVTVPCAVTDDGYVCELGALSAGTKFTVTIRYPLPAAIAGQKFTATASAASVDLDTGVETTLVSKDTTVTVPKRTVLSASLTPAKKITSVKRGAATTYRVTVRNAGVIGATGVKACATLSAGATVRAAKGATVHGRKVCWTLPTLKKGKSVTRTLTLVAPRKKGTVKVALAVTPKKSQASPVRLTAALPIS